MIKRIKNLDEHIIEGFTIVSDYQVSGKGQRGNAWISEPGKNLLFSINLKPSFLSANKVYLINVMIGVAIHKVISELLKDEIVEIKWPNDIYVNDKKVAGILVESFFGRQSIDDAVVGIGLNVNQSFFSLNTATSLLNVSGRRYNLNDVLESLLMSLESEYSQLKSDNKKQTLFYYHQKMRWRGELHTYSVNNQKFQAEIIGIEGRGKLVVKHNNQLSSYDLKEIEFVS